MASASTPQAPDAVIAELRRANAALQQERDAALAREAALAEVLDIINRSPGNLGPVFDSILEKAMRLCGVAFGIFYTGDLERMQLVARRGLPGAFDEYWQRNPVLTDMPPLLRVALETRSVQQVPDVREGPAYKNGHPRVRAMVDLGGARSLLMLPLATEDALLGHIVVFRQEVRRFSEKEIALLENFAAQAVIAMENARLLTEQREALERQTATAEVLQVINASPGNLAPVFDAILDKAMQLCGAAFGIFWLTEGEQARAVALGNVPPALAEYYGDRAHRAGPSTLVGRTIGTRAPVQVVDARADDAYVSGDPLRRASVDLGNIRTLLGVPLIQNGQCVGVLALFRQEVHLFSGREIALLESFAAQAVIAMENARLLGELQQRTAELAARNSEFGERIDQQAATIDVLKVMSASPDDTQPVFDQIVRRARELCNGWATALLEYDGQLVHLRAVNTPFAKSIAELAESGPEGAGYVALWPMAPTRASVNCQAILDKAIIHVRDQMAGTARTTIKFRSQLSIPLLRDGAAIGVIALGSTEPGGFTDSQVELLKTFAEQAVIAIGSVATYRALRERTAELGVQVARQEASIEVLRTITASPDDPQPVFEMIARRVRELCRVPVVSVSEFDGTMITTRAVVGVDSEMVAAMRLGVPMAPNSGSFHGRVALTGGIVHVRDLRGIDEMTALNQMMARRFGIQSVLAVPMLRYGRVAGAILMARAEPGGFDEDEVALVRSFADQAVIAISSARALRELQERTAELTRSVAELQALEEVLRAVNSSLDLATVLATIIDRAVPLAQADEGMIYEFDTAEQVFVPKAAFGMTEDRIARLRDRRIRIGETFLGRSAQERVPVAVDDVQQDTSIQGVAEVLAGIHAVLAVPLLRQDAVVGGLVIRRRTEGAFAAATIALMQTFAAQSVVAIENARLFETARRARAASDAALADLRRAQDRLVQTEKMASLGQLTAGIAHEIKNPLNFVNNFSELSAELIDELQEALAPAPIDKKLRTEVDDLTALLKSNLEKVVQHGKRADGIVKNMLLHSRESGGELRSVEVNGIVEEALNLAYHGARAEKPGFNISLVREFDPTAGSIELYPQEFTRVLLNLISNGFYAATRKNTDDPGFEPTLTVATEARPGEIAIRVRDNGIGIPDHVRAKMFEPFFTTKPAGEGTGLGLSLSHDIVVKQHGGNIAVATSLGAFTEFTITLPRPADRSETL